MGRRFVTCAGPALPSPSITCLWAVSRLGEGEVSEGGGNRPPPPRLLMDLGLRGQTALVAAGGAPAGPFVESTDEQWWAGIGLNLMSTVRLSRAVIPHMRRQGGGRIINIASYVVKQPLPNLVLSNAVRLAVVGLAKTLAAELGPDNILVNIVCPGPIAT